jgi:hypothetical protein
LLRSPLDALPSFFNHKWEQANHAGLHSTQGPESAWRTWRDQNFETEIRNWQNLLTSWRDQPYEIALYVPYEQLTNLATGPALFQRVVQELRRVSHVRVAAEEDIDCLWYTVVKKSTRTKRAPHKYTPGYTADQKHQMIQMLETTLEEFADDPHLVEIVQGYLTDVASHTRFDLNASSRY